MSSEKTEEPTAKRLKDAREKGQIPKSRELGTAAVILAAGGALLSTGEHMVDSLQSLLRLCLNAAANPAAIPPATMLQVALSTAGDVVLPILLAAMVAGAMASFLQVGPLLSLKVIEPKLEKLDVIKGIKNLFTMRQVVELAKTFLKMGIVFYVAWDVLAEGVRGIVGLTGRDAQALLTGTGVLASKLLFRVGGAVLAIAILDVFYQRWQHLRDQRMSKEETKREYKDAEGDPHTKQERDRVRREMAEHNTVQNVRDADVLVVNPTHLAIALQYDQETSDAPLVVAKGQEHLAARMIEIAKEAGVPIMRDVPLAHALYELDRGSEIPEILFEAVAAVLRAAWDETGELKGGLDE